MKKLILTVTILACIFACNDFNNRVEGNKNVVTKIRPLSEDFTKIEVNRVIDVIIEKSNTCEIEVEADSNIIDHIITTVVNGKLTITSDVNIENAEKTLVRVKMKQVTDIETTSASSLECSNLLKGKHLNILTTSASEVNIEGEYESINIEATSASEVTIKGKTLKLEVNSTSASDINAEELLANEVYAQANSASEITVHAIVLLDAKASSAGTIHSAKKPKELRNEETSGGEISIN